MLSYDSPKSCFVEYPPFFKGGGVGEFVLRDDHLKRDFAELEWLRGENVTKNSLNWILTFFSLSDPTKTSFSSKLEVMRISPEKISTKNIKN